MPRTTSLELRVRYAETDKMGVVYHSHYLIWCELGRTDHIREGGMSYREMEEAGIMLAVAEANIRYRAPARYDDLVRVETTLTDVSSRAVRRMTTSGLPGLPGDCVAVVVAALGRSTVVVCGRRAVGGGVAVVGFGADPTACDGA